MEDEAQIRELAISQVLANEDYQPRSDGLDEDHVTLLMETDPAEWAPLLVTPDGDHFVIIDGFHRREAAERLGIASLRCIAQEGAGYQEAFKANLRHGLPLAIEDRKRFARWLHDQEPELSWVELGKRTGLSDKTAKAAVMGASSDIPSAVTPTRVATAESSAATVEEESGTDDDPVGSMIDSMCEAEEEGSQIGFGADVRARMIEKALPQFEDPHRTAQILLEWGKASEKAATHYLTQKKK